MEADIDRTITAVAISWIASRTELDLPNLVTQHKDEKGEYDFDSTGIHLEIPNDL